MQVGVVEDVLAWSHWDLGSNPRSPQNNCLIFFLTCSYAVFQQGVHHTLKHPGAKWPQAWIQWSGDGDHGTPSQHMLW